MEKPKSIRNYVILNKTADMNDIRNQSMIDETETADSSTNAGVSPEHVSGFPTASPADTFSGAGTNDKEKKTSDSVRGQVFGIPKLDDMLGDIGAESGYVIAHVGEDHTNKARLGRAFLSRSFVGELISYAIFVTISHSDHCRFADRLSKQLSDRKNGEDKVSNVEKIKRNLIYRQLDLRDLSPDIIFHIISSQVEAAQMDLICKNHSVDQSAVKSLMTNPTTRRVVGPQIRIMIDDWWAIESTFPEIRQSKLLQMLIDYFKRENVKALFIDAQSGNPYSSNLSARDRFFRSLFNDLIHTWRVPFFGERRIAIMTTTSTATMPSRMGQVIVRELRPPLVDCGGKKQYSDERLIVDPHFESYDGLETGAPELIPVQVDLFTDTELLKKSVDQVNAYLTQVFVGRNGREIAFGYDNERYSDLRVLPNLQSHVELDYTRIIQVDESWAVQDGLLMGMYSYLNEELESEESDTSRSFGDPFGIFEKGRKRCEGFRKCDVIFRKNAKVFEKAEQPEDLVPAEKIKKQVDRVPYIWDFGFLLCDAEAWESASSKFQKVGEVWNTLRPYCREHTEVGEPVTWRDFLEACMVVQQNEEARGHSKRIGFDLDLHTVESLSSFILEAWFSKIYEKDASFNYKNNSLVDLLCKNHSELFDIAKLLMTNMPSGQIEFQDVHIKRRPALSNALAQRHWFTTACQVFSNTDNPYSQNLVPVAMPGRYRVRGDWSLAMTSGARSRYLGERVLDLISSRRANITRIQEGLGLPVRYFGSEVGLRDHDTGDDQFRELFTPLKCFENGIGSPQKPILYKDLLMLGAYKSGGAEEGTEFSTHWIFRSHITDYDLHSRIFKKWLKILVESAPQWVGKDLSIPSTNAFFEEKVGQVVRAMRRATKSKK